MRLPLTHVRQHEDHTCGLCSCRVVYHYYGLGHRHLRKGLKVDEPAIPGTDWSGTLPWDMLAQLKKDGFLVQCLSPDRSSLRKVVNRLDKGHPAVVLQGLHWVVLGGHHEGRLHIMDSVSHTASGWRMSSKQQALEDSMLIFSILGNDGTPRSTSIWELFETVPSLYDLFKGLV